MLLKGAAKTVLAVAKWSAKAAVQQTSDWYYYQVKEPDGLKEWVEENRENRKSV